MIKRTRIHHIATDLTLWGKLMVATAIWNNIITAYYYYYYYDSAKVSPEPRLVLLLIVGYVTMLWHCYGSVGAVNEHKNTTLIREHCGADGTFEGGLSDLIQ